MELQVHEKFNIMKYMASDQQLTVDLQFNRVGGTYP